MMSLWMLLVPITILLISCVLSEYTKKNKKWWCNCKKKNIFKDKNNKAGENLVYRPN